MRANLGVLAYQGNGLSQSTWATGPEIGSALALFGMHYVFFLKYDAINP